MNQTKTSKMNWDNFESTIQKVTPGTLDVALRGLLDIAREEAASEPDSRVSLEETYAFEEKSQKITDAFKTLEQKFPDQTLQIIDTVEQVQQAYQNSENALVLRPFLELYLQTPLFDSKRNMSGADKKAVEIMSTCFKTPTLKMLRAEMLDAINRLSDVMIPNSKLAMIFVKNTVDFIKKQLGQGDWIRSKDRLGGDVYDHLARIDSGKAKYLNPILNKVAGKSQFGKKNDKLDAIKTGKILQRTCR